jgi:hypothetical protein
MWKLSSNKVNELIKQMIITPELAMKEDLVEELKSALRDEMEYSLLLEDKEELDQTGNNVLTVEQDIDVVQIMKEIILLVGNTRWSNNINIVVEQILKEEMDKVFYLLCISHEPLYYLQLIKYFT